MAPATISHNKTISLNTSTGQIILIQKSDSPWALDLNTLVTIVLGVACIALQASQIYYERARKKRTNEPAGDDIEDGGARLLAHGPGRSFSPWRPSHSRDELEEYQSPGAARGRPASAVPLRGGASTQCLRRDGGVQLGGAGHLPEGYVYRRTPWQNSEWGPGARHTQTGPAPERHYARRQQPDFI